VAFQTEINIALKEPLKIAQPIKFLARKEIQNIIREDLNQRLTTGRILKEMARKGHVRLTTICNSIIRRKYFPVQWNVAQIIMIPKPGKPLEEGSSLRPISLITLMGKIFEKPCSRDYARY
jgi:hypothetical protein